MVNDLTDRENETLGHIFEGKSSKDAADDMYLSKRTVDFHLANAYRKLGVGNRVQAFRLLTKRGQLPVAASI